MYSQLYFRDYYTVHKAYFPRRTSTASSRTRSRRHNSRRDRRRRDGGRRDEKKSRRGRDTVSNDVSHHHRYDDDDDDDTSTTLRSQLSYDDDASYSDASSLRSRRCKPSGRKPSNMDKDKRNTATSKRSTTTAAKTAVDASAQTDHKSSRYPRDHLYEHWNRVDDNQDQPIFKPSSIAKHIINREALNGKL